MAESTLQTVGLPEIRLYGLHSTSKYFTVYLYYLIYFPSFSFFFPSFINLPD